MRFFLPTLIYICCANFAAAQNAMPEGISLQATLGFGRIVQHSPKFKASVRSWSASTELNIQQQTRGNKAWHITHKLPTLGLALTYANFGDPDIFGEAYSIMPNIAFGNRARCKKWYSFFRVGMGIAWLTKPFDALTNNTNTVIGQNLNNITDLRGGMGFWLSPNMELVAGASITHYSNGALQLPNLGINVPMLNVAMRYTLSPVTNYEKTEPSISGRRWHGFAQLDYGTTEQIVEGGPKYFNAGATVGALYDFSPLHHFFGGVTYEYSQTAYHWVAYQYPQESAESLFDRSSRVAIFVGDEFRFGQFSFALALGGYVKQSDLTPFVVYEKLIWRYYFLPEKQAHPYINIQMKAHLTAAEYFSIGGGYLF
jgi:hypothetical protein